MTILCEKIKELRIRNGLSRPELGDMLNVTHWTIGKYERGERTPDISMLISMADAFGVSLDELLSRSEYAKNGDSLTISEKAAPYTTALESEDNVLEFYSQLSEASKKAVLQILKDMINEKK